MDEAFELADRLLTTAMEATDDPAEAVAALALALGRMTETSDLSLKKAQQAVREAYELSGTMRESTLAGGIGWA